MSERSSNLARRSSRDPEWVRAVTLDASAKLFSQRGYAGTSFQHISAASGISVGLIQYHFGSKEQLYEAVKEYALTQYVHAQSAQHAMPRANIAEFLSRGLKRYVRFFETHSLWLRLSAWAELEGDLRLWPGEHDLLDGLSERLRAAQRHGELRDDVDPELLLVAIAGITQSWMRMRQRYASRLEHLGDARSRDEAFLRGFIDVLLRGAAANDTTVKVARAANTNKSASLNRRKRA